MSAQLAEPRTFMITNSAISSSEMDDHNATLTTLTTSVDHTLQTELLRTTSTENIADIVVDQTNNNNISNTSNTTPNPNSLLDDAETATAISMIPEALSAQDGEFHFITAENFDDVIAQEEVAVIRVVMPMEGSDASSNDANDNITTLSTIKNNDDLAQQVVNGQVALVQGIDGENTSPQFITVTVSAQDAGQNYQVQYVDTDIYHSNSSQTQMAYPFCAVGDYQTNGQSYYTTTATGNYTTSGSLNTPNTHAASAALSYLVPVDDNLLLTSSSQSHSRDSPNSLNEVAYLHEAHGTPQTNASMATIANSIGCDGGDGGMSSGANNVCSGGDTTPENDQTHLNSNTTNKIASATVGIGIQRFTLCLEDGEDIKWLSRNYETADGVSLPRSTLYNHYIQHCNENKIEPVNAASFGKLIRSVFSGLRTRRLGTRGNSKYHYYGIRIKPDSPLNQMMEEKDSFILQAATSSGGVGKTTAGGNPIFQMSGGSLQDNRIGPSRGGIHVSRTSKKHYFKPVSYETCAQFLGNGSAAIPPFPSIKLDNTFGSELTNEDVDLFRSMYREHCENFLDAILNLEFHTIEFLWREFWRDSSIDNSSLGDDCVGTSDEKFLSKTKLHLLCHCTAVQRFVQEVDYQFYQNLVEIIVPDVLRSIPNALTQAIRNFSKNMETWLCESMLGVPERMLHIKSVAVSAFCQTLRRYTSLNHLAQAARAVLQNSTQCSQMLHDLNRVDFHIVQEQAAWVCQCDPIVVQRLENGFKAALQQQSTLEQWATWLQLVVDSALQDYQGKPSFEKACRQFLLKWSFYSSMVIRDLTLRSAPSFGSFHLIRLLYDEYMLYLVEHKIAEVQQKTTIAVVCDHVKRDAESEFDYQVEFIASESTGSEQASKRSKQE